MHGEYLFNQEVDQNRQDALLHLPEYGFENIMLSAQSVACELYPDRNQDSWFTDTTSLAAGVFDGLGGVPKSEAASAAASHYMHQTLKRVNTTLSPDDAKVMLKSALTQSNTEVLKAGGETTAVVAKLFNDEAGEPYVGITWLGDSRAYLLRDGVLSFLTYDVGNAFFSNIPNYLKNNQKALAEAREYQELVDWKVLEHFQQRHIINTSLGNLVDKPIISTTHKKLQHGDTIILTSDGIHDNLTHRQIGTIAGAVLPSDITTRLIEKAQHVSRDEDAMRGKPDDMTAVVLRFY